MRWRSPPRATFWPRWPKARPARALVALGYAGWGAGQLEQELRDNAWLTVEADERILFDTALEDRWNAAVALVGVDPSKLSEYAGHA